MINPVLIKHHAMKTCGEVGIYLHTRWRWVVSFIPQPHYSREKVPDNHWTGGWVGPRPGLDETAKRRKSVSQSVSQSVSESGNQLISQSIYEFREASCIQLSGSLQKIRDKLMIRTSRYNICPANFPRTSTVTRYRWRRAGAAQSV
jgi:hypothetical protein